MGKKVKRLETDVSNVIIFDTFKSKFFRWFKGWRYHSENKDYIYFYNKYNSRLIGLEEKFINSSNTLNDLFTNESL